MTLLPMVNKRMLWL